MMDDLPSFDCVFNNQTDLYRAYMPFVINGGLFVPTTITLPLHSEVWLLVKLPDEFEVYKVRAKTIWITPRGAQCNKPEGMGMQIMDENSLLVDKINLILSSLVDLPSFSEKTTELLY